MKIATALIAAGVLSASLSAHAQGVQPNNQVRPGATQTPGVAPTIGAQRPGVQMAPGVQPGTQGGIAAPALPANLQNPIVAGQFSTDIFAMLQLLQQMAMQQRASAREQRDVAREAQFTALNDAAEKMKQAAAASLQQAQVNGAMAIASGAMTIGAGATAIGSGAAAQAKPSTQGKATSNGSAAPQAGQLKEPTKPLTAMEKQQGISAIMNAQQAFNASMAGADADKKKAEAIAMQAQAQAADAQRSQAQQTMQQMQDVIRDIQAKLVALQQAQTETAQRITRP